jgi:glutamate-1-semialdehyde 2,1-aminomutase
MTIEVQAETQRLYDEASRYIPGGTSRLHYYFPPYPIYARRGHGYTLEDVEGVERLDFLNNMTSLIHGHGGPAVKAAIVEQLDLGTAFSEPSEPEVRLARLMVERVRSLERIRFTNSGTEAVMLALKLARAYTGRSRIAKFEGFYHGYYDHVQVSYASSPADWGPADEPASTPSSGGLADSVPGEVVTLPYNHPTAVERLLSRHGRGIAALIVDPLSNRAGFPPPAEGFLAFLRQITRDLGIQLIFDEVISFRVGYTGASGRYGGEPDLVAFGKIMGGGFPIGATGGTAEVMEVFDPGSRGARIASGGTFSGNPVSMAAGLTAMTPLDPAAFERLEGLGDRLRRRMTEVLRSHRVPGQVTGDGSLFRLLLTDRPLQNYRDGVDPGAQAQMEQLFYGLLGAGVLLHTSGLGCLSTPMGEPEVEEIAVALDRALAGLRLATKLRY